MFVYYMYCMLSYMHSFSRLSTTNAALDVVNDAVTLSIRRLTMSFGIVNKLSKHKRYLRSTAYQSH